MGTGSETVVSFTVSETCLPLKIPIFLRSAVSIHLRLSLTFLMLDSKVIFLSMIFFFFNR